MYVLAFYLNEYMSLIFFYQFLSWQYPTKLNILAGYLIYLLISLSE